MGFLAPSQAKVWDSNWRMVTQYRPVIFGRWQPVLSNFSTESIKPAGSQLPPFNFLPCFFGPLWSPVKSFCLRILPDNLAVLNLMSFRTWILISSMIPAWYSLLMWCILPVIGCEMLCQHSIQEFPKSFIVPLLAVCPATAVFKNRELGENLPEDSVQRF